MAADILLEYARAVYGSLPQVKDINTSLTEYDTIDKAGLYSLLPKIFGKTRLARLGFRG